MSTRKNIFIIFFFALIFSAVNSGTALAQLDSDTESLESVTESAEEASEGLGSAVEPTETLNEASKPVGEDPYDSLDPVDKVEADKSMDSVFEGPGEVEREPEYIPPSEEPGYEKPLGVREAEGKVIGE